MPNSHPKVKHPSFFLKEKQGVAKFNNWLGLKITNKVGTMWCAYVFVLLDLLMLPPVIKSHDLITWVTYIAQTVIQLVLLPVIMVGQNQQQEAKDASDSAMHQALTHVATTVDEINQKLK